MTSFNIAKGSNLISGDCAYARVSAPPRMQGAAAAADVMMQPPWCAGLPRAHPNAQLTDESASHALQHRLRLWAHRRSRRRCRSPRAHVHGGSTLAWMSADHK